MQGMHMHPEDAVKRLHLMCSADEVQVVLCKELQDAVRSKGVRHPAVVLAPAFDLFIRVSP